MIDAINPSGKREQVNASDKAFDLIFVEKGYRRATAETKPETLATAKGKSQGGKSEKEPAKAADEKKPDETQPTGETKEPEKTEVPKAESGTSAETKKAEVE